MGTNQFFYQNLIPFNEQHNMFNLNFYHKIPSNWYIIITDIKGSTQAVSNGHYKDINVVSVASIIAVQNACGDTEIPFIFGGDGAFIFAPDLYIDEIKKALVSTKKKSANEFNLLLRTSIIPVEDIHKKGSEIFLAKMKLSPTSCIAMAKGQGLEIAEFFAKQSEDYEVQGSESEDTSIYKGLDCKWDSIPSKKDYILTLIIHSQEKNIESYQEIITKINTIAPQASLIEKNQTNIHLSIKNFFKELKITHKGMSKFTTFLTGCFKMYLSYWISKYKKKPLVPLDDLEYNTDQVKFDNSLRMVIDVSKNEKDSILKYLNNLQDLNKITFGYHAGKAAVITCFVRSAKGHVHFVDGSGGGYTKAAEQMKLINRVQVKS